ncbi:mitogen-activated protein kinase kinase kinase YODA isoform X2 [Cajanus cajan]|uniref:mitogen-activated protein kinase kinase kinase YODA isoform X2 n=1 Tax=Cajanus cajan TaxID=3821 RepID=UPI00098DCE45|nr:mitogen-activated protein kinase kinase kinase YODA isoform X2 [Cajanus cajan]
MPSWWGKSSSKEVKKKPSRESIIDTIQRKLKNASEEKCNNNSGRSRYLDDAISKKGSRSLTPSRSPSPTTHVSRCQSFAERPSSQPLPLPRSHLPAVVDATSGLILSSKLERAIGSKPSLHFPLPKPGFVSNKEEPTYAEGDIGTASVSSDSSVDSGNSFDSPHIVSPLAFDYENGKKANINSYFSVVHKNQPVTTIQSNSGTSSRPAPQLCNNKPLSTSPKGGPLHLQNLQIAHPGGLCSAPDSSMSSPSRSPMGAFGPEKMLKSGLRTGRPYSDIASSLVSGHNSGHISVGGDLSGQMFWPQNRCSPECSPIPSPRMTSPGPSSRIQSGSVTPLHPQAGGTAAEARPGGLCSAADSSMSSPSRSPMGAFGTEKMLKSGLRTGKPYSDIASGHCSSLVSGHNFGHISVGGDLSGQMFWPQNRCSPECSPIPSPRMTSPGPSSRIQSGSVTPLHPQAGGTAAEARPGGLCSAPDSSMSSPSRSPMGAFGTEKMLKSGLRTGKPYSDIASGHCSTLVSGHNSGNISVGGDLSGQMFWPQNRCSPECSPIPSPRMTSPGPSSRIQSGSVTPLHPQAGGTAAEAPTRRPDDMKQQTHQLPIRPITVTNPYPFSPTYSASTTPSAPHSPSGAENPTGPGPRWKKGQLLGRGTFGHVYLGFNRESGEMCAMKEVTLFQDDAKSRESAQQLGQEIALLSGLRHPNIVQYYGSETVDDKLYVYLEYVSGGSIYKLVREYGQLGEIAIRNYTRQILLGLAYLHAKNTVHRDIKGANILVDPSGRIKLADFGMAKHISGPSCPFSFKGSPYWMAPEVIKNSNGCNLAVDIWSLGCTVLEMATTKPPWSQYEGVAAMFKIGNSKELPTIPDHLSEDGKDFVMLCLQRDPENRPSAAQLLEHPFVKNAMLERSILTALPAEAPPAIINAVKSLGIGPAKHNLCLDSEAAGIYPLRSLRTGFGSSDVHPSRNISCPVSPTGSLLYKSSHTSGWMSPSPISSPHTVSGSSSPLTSGGGAIPFHQTKQPIFSHDVMGMIQKSRNDFYSNGNTAHPEYKHEQFGRNFQTTHACRDVVSSDNDALPNHSMRFVQGDPIEIRDGKSYLADCVSQQLLRDYVRLNACLGIMEEAPKRDRFNGL